MSIRRKMLKDGKAVYPAVITRPDGQRTKTFARKIDAQEWERKVRSGDLSRLSTAAPINHSTTFAELAREWMSRHAVSRKAPGSVKSDEQCLRLHLLPELGHCELDMLTVRDIELALEAIRQKKTFAPKSLNNFLGLARKILNDACRWGYLERNPAQFVQPYPILPREDTSLTEKEVNTLVEFVEPRDAESGLVYRTATVTGMRAGELRALQTDCLDFERKLIAVRRIYCAKSQTIIPRTKSNKIRWQVMTPTLAEKLGEFCGGKNGLLFQGFDWHHASANLKAWCRQAGIREVRFHDLRHTSASIMVSKGVSLYAVQQHLGHSSPAMTQRYAHLARPALTEAVHSTFDL